MSTLSRTRPGTSSRWIDSQAWILKPTLEEGLPNWLGMYWLIGMNEKEGRDTYDGSRYPSVNEIQCGIQ